MVQDQQQPMKNEVVDLSGAAVRQRLAKIYGVASQIACRLESSSGSPIVEEDGEQWLLDGDEFAVLRNERMPIFKLELNGFRKHHMESELPPLKIWLNQ